jgi:hypothetical protein
MGTEAHKLLKALVAVLGGLLALGVGVSVWKVGDHYGKRKQQQLDARIDSGAGANPGGENQYYFYSED